MRKSHGKVDNGQVQEKTTWSYSWLRNGENENSRLVFISCSFTLCSIFAFFGHNLTKAEKKDLLSIIRKRKQMDQWIVHFVKKTSSSCRYSLCGIMIVAVVATAVAFVVAGKETCSRFDWISKFNCIIEYN